MRSGQTKGPPESPEQGEIPPASEPAQIIPGKKSAYTNNEINSEKITKPICDY